LNYRTEIYVATDRYVCLQLPDYVPQGRAVVTVTFTEDFGDEPGMDLEGRDDDRQDIEWWDDLDDDLDRDA
jgi:hypothetical protein